MVKRRILVLAVLSLTLSATAVVGQAVTSTVSTAALEQDTNRAARRADFSARLDASQTVPLESNDASGFAAFWFNRNRTQLHYTIRLSRLDIDSFATCSLPVEGCDPLAFGDDVTKIHLHVAPAGMTGPHALNIYKAPRQDDRDLTVSFARGLLRGRWGDDDENLSFPPSLALSSALESLCAGEIYINVHTVDHPTGAIRGQVLPTSKACESLGF